MEELKAKNIIENLESIAAEKGADALTGEIIEECCRTNGADPEDFKNFICENIDLQKIKELQGSEELLPEKLGQVAGGARPVKQGMASFLAATSLLGSAANFTVSAGNDALANAKRDIHTAQLIDLQKSVEQKNSRNKKKQSTWTGWDTLKYIGLGSFVTCASAVAYWAYSQKKRYAQFSELLNKFENKDIHPFYSSIIGSGFTNTALVINSFTNLRDPWMVRKSNFSLINETEVVDEIGPENVSALEEKLRDAHNYYLSCLDSGRCSSSSSSSSSGSPYPEHCDPRIFEDTPKWALSSSSSSSTSSSRNGRERVSGQDNSSDSPSAYTSKVGYSEYNYSPVEVYRGSLDDEKRKGNRERLTTNVNSGIERFKRLSPEYKKFTYRYDASEFFSTKRIIIPQNTDEAAKYVGPRRGCKGCHKDIGGNLIDSYNLKPTEEFKYVYNLPDGHCTVYDHGKYEPIRVENDTSGSAPARLWWVERFSLPALFAVDAALRKGGEPGLNPEATVVQNAGNAVSPGGDILAGNGSQEESLMMDTDAYLFLNSEHAYENYYLKNEEEIAKKRTAKDNNYSTAAVDDWNGTGIFDKAIYSKGVGLRGAKNGETINMITTAAADYNKGHKGTYMGPIEVDNNLLPYEIQLIHYWINILFTAYKCHNRCIVLTLGGGGAYEGDPDTIIDMLFKALSEFGPNKNCCFARCFDEIIIAIEGKEGNEYRVRKGSTNKSVTQSKSQNVEGLLYTPYKSKFGSGNVRHIEAQTGN